MAAIVQIRIPQTDGPSADEKERQLLANLAELPSVIVALSGGADSAYLAWAAQKALGSRALSVTALSPSYSTHDRNIVEDFVRAHNIHHEFVETREMENPAYRANAADRCFHCKDELFTVLDEIAQQRGFAATAYGVNADDTLDFRPGHRAAKEHRVLAPLLDVGMRKSEIRELSQRANLPTWNRPASACLASRVPYGTEVTPERLGLIERGEAILRELGFQQFRVRLHDNDKLARVEIAPEEMPRAFASEMAAEISARLKAVGLRLRRARPRRLPPGLAERSAQTFRCGLRAQLQFEPDLSPVFPRNIISSISVSIFERGRSDDGGNMMPRQRNLIFGIAIAALAVVASGCQMGPAVYRRIRSQLQRHRADPPRTLQRFRQRHDHRQFRQQSSHSRRRSLRPASASTAQQKRLDAIVSNPPVEQKGDTIRVGKDFGKIHNVSIAYTIEVPHDTEISTQVVSGSQDISNVRGPVKVDSASGSIKVNGVERATTLNTLSGSIDVQNIGDDLRASSASGSVMASKIKGDVRISALSGETQIIDPGGRVDADTGQRHRRSARSDARRESARRLRYRKRAGKSRRLELLGFEDRVRRRAPRRSGEREFPVSPLKRFQDRSRPTCRS